MNHVTSWPDGAKTYHSDDGPPCPHCGHVHTRDLFEFPGAYEDGDHTATCENPKCEREFTYTTSVSFSYASEMRAPRESSDRGEHV